MGHIHALGVVGFFLAVLGGKIWFSYCTRWGGGLWWSVRGSMDAMDFGVPFSGIFEQARLVVSYWYTRQKDHPRSGERLLRFRVQDEPLVIL